jgi:hypothetical protein
MVNSVSTPKKIDFLIFPSSPHRRVQPKLERLLAGSKIALSRAPKHLHIETPKFEVANTTHYYWPLFQRRA